MAIKHHIITLLWACLILLIMCIPGNYIPKPPRLLELFSPDKILHVLLFAPLSFLIARGFWKQTKQLKKAMLISLSFGIIYALTTELLQYFVVSGRNGNIYDAIADCIGIFIGVYLFYKIHRIKV